jgi:hypothetical protein
MISHRTKPVLYNLNWKGLTFLLPAGKAFVDVADDPGEEWVDSGDGWAALGSVR